MTIEELMVDLDHDEALKTNRVEAEKTRPFSVEELKLVEALARIDDVRRARRAELHRRAHAR